MEPAAERMAEPTALERNEQSQATLRKEVEAEVEEGDAAALQKRLDAFRDGTGPDVRTLGMDVPLPWGGTCRGEPLHLAAQKGI